MKQILLILTFFCIIISAGGLKSFSRHGGNLPAAMTGSQGEDTTRYVYLGAEACAAKCHNSEELGYQYESWKNSRHSRSWESLSTEKALGYSKKSGLTEKPDGSLTCLKCHITAAGYDPASLSATYKKEDGITCEACHKGEFTRKTFVPAEADCLKCHNNSVHEVSPFDFYERCLKIAHPRSKTKEE
jgi:hypothetical protein